MATAIDGLRPALVWKYFAEISRIPRCSGNEAAVARYVIETAKKLKLQAIQDKFGNVVVKKPASKGREKVRTITLQGHLDMVGEKNAGTRHDFTRDPIELVREGNILRANGTTLGADNGVAVATNLAIMEDRSLEHGPLEFLFTVDEEVGLNGANNLESDFLESRTLLNLDSEEEGSIYVGCSGGTDTLATWSVTFENAPGGSVSVAIKAGGLRGGHSGLEIDKGRGNAIKIIARVLVALAPVGVRLSKIEGGNKRNAIPRECDAILCIPKLKLDRAVHIVEEFNRTVKAELASVEPEFAIIMDILKGARRPRVIKPIQQKKILQTLLALPHGVIKMSADIPGLVETSTNVAVIRTSNKAILMETSQRSSVASEMHEIAQTVESIFVLGGAMTEHAHEYPGWKPNLDSPILKIARTTYQKLYGRAPEIKAIHAGLECGIIGEKYPGMDMISFGPTLEGVHSPDEKIYIDTVEKFWSFLLAILKNAA